MPTAHFSKVLIISSLKVGDNQTARDLFDWIEAVKKSQGWEIVIEYQEANSASSLVALLKNEVSMAKSTGSIPIIHIEAHGTEEEDGIVLKDDSWISWSELHPCLAELNIATKMNLILILGLCSGAHFAAHIVPSDYSPCWMMIGPKSEVIDFHLKDRFIDFYRIILNGGGGEEALRAINARSKYGETNTFFITTAESFFKVAYRRYLLELTTDEACKERAKKIREGLRGVLFPLPHSRAIALELMTNKGVFFEDHKKKFFMIHLWEENEERFPVTFDDVAIPVPS